MTNDRLMAPRVPTWAPSMQTATQSKSEAESVAEQGHPAIRVDSTTTGRSRHFGGTGAGAVRFPQWRFNGAADSTKPLESMTRLRYRLRAAVMQPRGLTFVEPNG